MSEYQQAIENYRQKVFSFAHYSLRAREDAEDVTQEVFIKLWQNWRKIDHSRLGAWLMRVAHNAVVDTVRRRSGADQVDAYADVETLSGSEQVDEGVDRDRFREQLQLAIQSLDDPFRSILVMRDIQGMSYADIREILEMSESQVKVYLHRGRRRLRENALLRKIYSDWSGSQPIGAAAPQEEARH